MPQKHIIDTLIEERAPKLVSSGFWPIIRPVMNFILGYKKAVNMADHLKDKNGDVALDFVSQLLDLRCYFDGFENLPANGPVIVIANHPSGIADGVALFDVLKKYRGDLKFYANSDAMRICPNFDDVLIPVEWKYERRTREKTRLTLSQTQETIKDGNVLGIFPAGRLSRIINGRLQDPEWASSCVSIAKKYNIPILPVSIKGPNAFWFHFFGEFSQELRDITLFHELLNKKGKQYFLHAGKLIYPFELDDDNQSAILKLKTQIEAHFAVVRY